MPVLSFDDKGSRLTKSGLRCALPKKGCAENLVDVVGTGEEIEQDL